MAKQKTTNNAPQRKSTESALSRFQKYDIAHLERADIKNAPYNPRTIDDYARDKLKKKIATVGLLQPLVVNKRTGHLVSGHQRLSILDALEGHNKYKITVSLVDLSPKEEKEMCVFFNNDSAMGTWDLDLLKDIIKDPVVSNLELGFDNVDIQMLFDDDPDLAPLFATESPKVEDDVKKMQDWGKKRSESVKKDSERRADIEDPEYILIVTFPNRHCREQFLQKVKVDKDTRYMDGVKLGALVGVKFVY